MTFVCQHIFQTNQFYNFHRLSYSIFIRIFYQFSYINNMINLIFIFRNFYSKCNVTFMLYKYNNMIYHFSNKFPTQISTLPSNLEIDQSLSSKNYNQNSENSLFKNQLKKTSLNKFVSGNQIRWGDLILGPIIGVGEFGIVKQVKNKMGQTQLYALKIIRKNQVLKKNQLEHLKNQRQILSNISHPFIVGIKSTFQDQFNVYMLMEYICGGEIFDRLKSVGRFSSTIAQFYIAQTLLALNYLHQKNITYRDLKPQNILIDRQGHIRLIDFGFAKYLPNNRTRSILGTPQYFSPQIIQCSRSKGQNSMDYGKSVDWWTLGILLFQMLTGQTPFRDSDPILMMDKIIAGKFQFPKFFSPLLKDLIKKLLNPNPLQRLGANDNGISIMNHKWFKLNWQNLKQKKVEVPWIPRLEFQQDISYFQQIQEQPQQFEKITAQQQYLFKDF